LATSREETGDKLSRDSKPSRRTRRATARERLPPRDGHVDVARVQRERDEAASRLLGRDERRPEPENGSQTTSPTAPWFRMGGAMHPTGLVVAARRGSDGAGVPSLGPPCGRRATTASRPQALLRVDEFEEVSRSNAKPARQLRDVVQGDVHLATLDLADVAAVHVGLVGEALLREASSVPQHAQASAEEGAENGMAARHGQSRTVPQSLRAFDGRYLPLRRALPTATRGRRALREEP
jgi:hypothetical protein